MESKQTIKLHCLENRVASGYVTFGSYWEKGILVIPNFKNDGMDSFVLQNENKESIPVQSRITAWWPDGSIKWVAHTADASKMGQEAALTAQIKLGEVSEETAELVSMIIRRDDNWLYIDNGVLSLKVPTGKNKADTLAEDIFLNGKLRVKKASPVLYLEEQGNENSTNFDLDGQTKVTRAYKAAITAVTIEEDGPLALTIKAEGSYQHQNQNKMKFCIRMYINKDSSDIRFVHTFFFDGDEQTDFLKGLGIRFDTVLEGRPYEHHIRFAGELPFKEAAILLNSSYPRLQPSVLKNSLMEKRGATRQTVMSKRQQPIFQYGTDIFFIRTVLIITESVSRQSRSVVCLVPQKEDVRMEQWRYVVKMEASFLVSVISGRNIRLVLR